MDSGKDEVPTFKVDWEKAKLPTTEVNENSQEGPIILPREKFAVPALEQAAKNIPEKNITFGQMKEVAWPDGANFVGAYTTIQKDAIAAQQLIMDGSTVASPNVVLTEQIKDSVQGGVFTDTINIAGNFSLPPEDVPLGLDVVAWAQAEINKHILPEHFTTAKAATFLIKINDQPWGIVGTGVNLKDNKPIEYGIFATGNLLTAKSGIGFKQIVS